MPFMLVKFDNPETQPQTAWQETDDQGNLIGLFDDDGERIFIGNCSWTAISSKIAPPFLGE